MINNTNDTPQLQCCRIILNKIFKVWWLLLNPPSPLFYFEKFNFSFWQQKVYSIFLCGYCLKAHLQKSLCYVNSRETDNTLLHSLLSFDRILVAYLVRRSNHVCLLAAQEDIPVCVLTLDSLEIHALKVKFLLFLW